jgi:hypothetical protein
MSYPPVIDLQSFLRAKDEATLDTPSTDKAINVAMAVIDNHNNKAIKGHHLGNGSDIIKVVLRAAFIPPAIIPPLTPSVDPPP